MVNVWESVAVPSYTVTLMECMPFCDSVGVQVNTPVVLCMVTPGGGLAILYVRLLAGMSVSVAVMFSANADSSGIVWFDILFSTGGVCVNFVASVTDTLSKYMLLFHSDFHPSEVNMNSLHGHCDALIEDIVAL